MHTLPFRPEESGEALDALAKRLANDNPTDSILVAGAHDPPG